ncbi:MAG: 50S ribosomal protein L29 [Terracidiphilus sp.]|jgi:large subunit ribosomal protein L29
MELEKIRNLSDEELAHQEKTASEQLFRIRFQVSLQPNEGVRKLQQLRKEIAQIKTVARERALGIRGAAKDSDADASTAAESKKGVR